MNTSREELRARLLALGFDDVRFVQLAAVEGRFLREWLGQGMHGDMQWMERSVEKRLDPRQVLPGARSAVLLGVNYWPGKDEGADLARSTWARYSVYSDYHDTLKPALVAVGRVLEEVCGLKGTEYRYYVDTGPVVERGWAARAGLGFIGKNGMLISRKHGNWLFLAAVLTTADIESDPPIREKVGDGEQIGLLCGKCTRCMEACPTEAIRRPGVIDARLCISYQTIENRGIIPRELRRKIGTHIYGCDVCLEVCPWNRFAQKGRQVLLEARGEIARLGLAELLALTPERFAAVFKGTAIKRVKLAGILRNASVVAANTGATDCLDRLVVLAQHDLPMVRAHAVWAVFQLTGGRRAEELLAAAHTVETEGVVLSEYAACRSESAL